jgi:pyruvate kinase
MPEIYATLGPRCSDAETLAAMFDAGMTGVRLNLSHITLHDAAAEIENLHLAAQKCGVKARLLIDMQGPELRIGTLEQPVTLQAGDIVRLGAGGIPVPEIILPALQKGQRVLLDDGKILLELLNRVEARVIHGGSLQSRAGNAAGNS